MIGTLASGFVFQSMAIAYSRTSHAAPAPALISFSAARLLDLPIIALIFIIFTALVGFALNRSVLGRSALAIGQNARGAQLAGLALRRTLACVYVFSTVLAAVAGILLSACSGGAALDMGADYLLSVDRAECGHLPPFASHPRGRSNVTSAQIRAIRCRLCLSRRRPFCPFSRPETRPF